eukprot:gnl/Dysnectes_brevis/2830_a3455_1313.p1 GENE.gnl/Dysnectes_brevis/2830_a3455_1313~~gnl/Dysnectes_brevis/2830_a3455_1313.p1  ORF type:complete len:305 (-),score=117.95 gnl/Dysnectes_brevis/2830_a3455_1313:128-1021(-)
MSEQQQLAAALDLSRRLPTTNLPDTVAKLCKLAPHLTEDLLAEIDQPLRVLHDTEEHQPFIACDYNRDGDSFRSPYSNQYFPAFTDGYEPMEIPETLRSIEQHALEQFRQYTDIYFEEGVCSVYAYEAGEDEDADPEAEFGIAILIHKQLDGSREGVWDSVHVFSAVRQADGSYEYSQTGTVLLYLVMSGEGRAQLAGSFTEKAVGTGPGGSPRLHVESLGRMVENMEISLMEGMEVVYFSKTEQIYQQLRRKANASEAKAHDDLHTLMAESIKRRNEMAVRAFQKRKEESAAKQEE